MDGIESTLASCEDVVIGGRKMVRWLRGRGSYVTVTMRAAGAVLVCVGSVLAVEASSADYATCPRKDSLSSSESETCMKAQSTYSCSFSSVSVAK